MDSQAVTSAESTSLSSAPDQETLAPTMKMKRTTKRCQRSRTKRTLSPTPTRPTRPTSERENKRASILNLPTPLLDSLSLFTRSRGWYFCHSQSVPFIRYILGVAHRTEMVTGDAVLVCVFPGPKGVPGYQFRRVRKILHLVLDHPGIIQ